MPHIVVKLWPGRSEETKQKLADALAKCTAEITNSSEDYVSVAFEEVAQADWSEKIYGPEIKAHWDDLYKKPGYEM